MSRALITLRGNADRERAANWIAKAPPGTRVEFKATKRSLPQNDRMWAMLSDVSDQLAWHGQRLKAAEWKILFLDALNRELRTVPDIYGIGVVALGRSSSDLTKDEMSQLIELIACFAAEHGVKFGDDEAEQTTIAPEQAEPVNA